MTTHRDPDRIIRAFLDEDVAELPARTYDIVRAEIGRTRQRVVIGPWTTPDVNRPNVALTAVAVVAVVVVAVVVVGLRPSLGLIGGPSSPPSPTPERTTIPADTSPASPLPSSGAIDPGRYYIVAPNAVIQLTMPAGWTAAADRPAGSPPDAMTVSRPSSGPDRGYLDLTLAHDVTQVVTDICVDQADEAYAEIGLTPEALSSALASQIARQRSEALADPSEVMLGGHPAKKFVLTYPTECPGPEGRWIWANDAPGHGAGILKNGTTTVYVVDVDGARHVITSSYRAASAGDVAELDALIASIDIAPAGVEPAGSGRTALDIGKEAIDAGPFELPWPQGPPDARIVVTIPDGWWKAGPDDPSISQGSGFISQPTLNVAAHSVSRVVASVCASPTSAPEVGPSLIEVGRTVDDLATALGGVAGTQWSSPADVTIDGYPAKRLETTYSAADCAGPSRRWMWIDGSDAFFVEDGVTSTIYVVDVDGDRLVITTQQRAPMPQEVAQLASVIASIDIERHPVGGSATTPSSRPTTADVFPVSIGPDADLRIGRHAAVVEGVPFTFEIPSSGWETQLGFYVSKSTSGPQGAEATLRWTVFPNGVNTDPCPSVLSERGDPSLERLADAVATAPGVDAVTGPADVTVGGRRGKHVVLRVRDDLGCDPGYFYTYEAPIGGALWTQTHAGDTVSVWIVDVDGTMLLIEGESHDDAAPAASDEIQQIVDSIQFG